MIQCPNRACIWKGKLEDVTTHLPNCAFRTGQLPDWFNRYLASREEEFERADEQLQNLDDDVRDKFKNEEVQPLAIRLFNAERPELNAQLGRMIEGGANFQSDHREEYKEPKAQSDSLVNQLMALENDALKDEESDQEGQMKIGDVFDESNESSPIIYRYNEYSDFGPIQKQEQKNIAVKKVKTKHQSNHAKNKTPKPTEIDQES